MTNGEIIKAIDMKAEKLTIADIEKMIDSHVVKYYPGPVIGGPAPHMIGLYQELRNCIEVTAEVILLPGHANLDVNEKFDLVIRVKNNAPRYMFFNPHYSWTLPNAVFKIKVNIDHTSYTVFMGAAPNIPVFNLSPGITRTLQVIKMKTTTKLPSPSTLENLANVTLDFKLNYETFFTFNKKENVEYEIREP